MTALPLSAAADEYERVAAQLCKTAQRLGKGRVAVLPFQSMGRRSGLAGTVVAEKLTAAVAGRGEVEVVEGTLLAAVLREQRFERSGAVDGRSVKELGRVLGVDALVAGTVMELRDGRFEFNGRLIDTESARILAAASAKVEPDWAQSLFDDLSWSLPSWGSFELTGSAQAAEFDAPDCERAAEETDDLDRVILDVKARYWAGRLKDRDIERGSLKRNPGSEIANQLTRQEFYRVLRAHYDDPGMRRVSGQEFARMQETQSQIDRIARACGRDGA